MYQWHIKSNNSLQVACRQGNSSFSQQAPLERQLQHHFVQVWGYRHSSDIHAPVVYFAAMQMTLLSAYN